MKFLNKLLAAFSPEPKVFGKRLIHITELPRYDSLVKAIILGRLQDNGESNPAIEEVVLGLTPIECLGVPEGTIAAQSLLYTQLTKSTTPTQAIKILDKRRIDGFRIDVHEGMTIWEYLRIRVYQELHQTAKPTLSDNLWKCNTTFFVTAYLACLESFPEMMTPE